MRFSFFLFLAFGCLCAKGQVPFAQASQTPLLLNPSMSGNKNKHRLAFSYNQLDSKVVTIRNEYASYDGFSKKIGSGFGIVYSGQHRISKTAPTDWQENIAIPGSPNTIYTQQNRNSATLIVAPKYNVMNKVYFQEIKYSISPSFYVGYENGRTEMTNDFRYTFKKRCTCEDPSGKLINDSVSYSQSVVNERKFTVGLGLMFTSDNLLFFMRLQHETSLLQEGYSLHHYRFPTSSASAESYTFRETLYALQAMVGIGISLPKKQTSPFSVTPMLAIGLRKYLNLDPTKPENSSHYLTQINFQKSQYEMPTSHASINFKYHFLVGGVAFTRNYQNNYTGVSLGYQNMWSKTMATFNYAFLEKGYSLLEIGTGVWF